eukprot:1913563-Pyramimonas_sp.AAC.1
MRRAAFPLAASTTMQRAPAAGAANRMRGAGIFPAREPIKRAEGHLPSTAPTRNAEEEDSALIRSQPHEGSDGHIPGVRANRASGRVLPSTPARNAEEEDSASITLMPSSWWWLGI